MPLPRVDHLLRAERDQHAEHDDGDFASELAPAAQRLWQMEVNSAGPPRA
jgi:hypothetical protein